MDDPKTEVARLARSTARFLERMAGLIEQGRGDEPILIGDVAWLAPRVLVRDLIESMEALPAQRSWRQLVTDLRIESMLGEITGALRLARQQFDERPDGAIRAEVARLAAGHVQGQLQLGEHQIAEDRWPAILSVAEQCATGASAIAPAARDIARLVLGPLWGASDDAIREGHRERLRKLRGGAKAKPKAKGRTDGKKPRRRV